MFIKNRRGAMYITLMILVTSAFFIWQAIYHIQNSNILTVAFLDVGQGDAIFIESPSGVQVLIDGGASNKVLRELSKVMPFYDRSIDMVVATHPDTDHIGGLIDVLNRFAVSRIVRPNVVHDSPAVEALHIAIENEKRNGAVEVFARRGQVYDLGHDKNGDTVELHILFPDRAVDLLETNMASVVARLVYGKTSVMLTGDSPQAIEKYLVDLDGSNLQSDILKLGHHGSKTSTSQAFLGFVNPSMVIVSAGVDNRYGHPHDEIVSMIQSFGVGMKNTAESGSIIFTSDGNEWVLQ